MSEKRCGEIIKQTLQTRRNQIPRKISFTLNHEPRTINFHNLFNLIKMSL
ncbi:MAG: hypothetical protein F6K58_18665 [Symploca sp. SIO2E9]|nr:hypothetical protein [Symploca sp. SIO2E9]